MTAFGARAAGCALVLALWAGRAGAAPPPEPGPWRFSVRQDAASILSTRTLIVIGVGAALTGAALAVEDPAAQARSLEHLHDIPDVGNTYGSSNVVVGGTLGLAAAGQLAGRDGWKRASLDLARSYAYTVVVVGTLKVAVGRTRPDGGTHSFPSGHAGAAFCVAPVLARHFGPWVGAAGYTLAVVTALGRMEDEKHYLSDVIGGGTIGFAIGEAIARQRIRSPVTPLVEPDRVGLLLRF